jgi:hypothetical protein
MTPACSITPTNWSEVIEDTSSEEKVPPDRCLSLTSSSNCPWVPSSTYSSAFIDGFHIRDGLMVGVYERTGFVFTCRK